MRDPMEPAPPPVLAPVTRARAGPHLAWLIGDDGLTDQVQQRLASPLFVQSETMWIGGLTMVLVGLLAWLRTHLAWLFVWTVLCPVVLLARQWLAQAWARRTDPDPRRWARWFAYGAWANGLQWGALSLVVITTHDAFTQFMAISVQSGYLAGGATRNHTSPAAAFGQVYLTLTPLALVCLSTGSIYFQAFTVFVLANILAHHALIGFLSRGALRTILQDEAASRLLADLSEANGKLSRLARTDVLTGLPNRAEFIERLTQAFAAHGRGGEDFAVLYMDLDRFKDINDTLGHPVGDQLLKAVAERLAGAVRETDLVARFGGDEFAVLTTNLTDVGGAGVLAAKLREAVAQPFQFGPDELRVTLSVGVSPFTDDTAGPEDMLAKADLALYRAKDEGRDQCRFHSEDLDREVRERVALAADLRHALDHGELELLFEPLLEISTGRIASVEALVHWRHPERGLLGPAAFLPAAEKAGAILPLGQWVLDRACGQMRAWRSEGVPLAAISVDLALAQLKAGDDLVEEVAAALARWRLPADALELAVTESMLATITLAQNDVLERLRRTGVRISIGDFGGQYSSLDCG